MTTPNNACLTVIDTSNLGFNLSPCIKELMEADLNPESGLMTMMFLPIDSESNAILSFVTVVQEQGDWWICSLEVFEIKVVE